MAHGFTFQELAQKDAISSEKVKKALNINSAYDKELKKGLSCLQKEQRSLMNSLTRQKLDLVHKKSRLPSIHVARSSSAWVKDDSKQRNGSPAMDTKSGNQVSSKEMYKFFREKSHFVASSKGSMVNDDELSDHEDEDEPLSAWFSKAPKDVERSDSRLSAKVAKEENESGRMTSPAFDSRPPHSPSFQSRFYRSNTLDPNTENTESRSQSVASSPRSPRRRANTLDTPQQLLHSSSSDLRKMAVERSYSSPEGVERSRAESTPLDFEVSHSFDLADRRETMRVG